ncbi:hypothetical protein DB32_003720 [Sandaracinus amylolyticus]|uniref:Uncharacterized protein n=1 Tax=Sandaracinus amylolyticus TaxID=927083 RepID=A0A0F6W3R9_9BACT|nr:hypothetical protein DB32_003720 [Sandaracinus amylolyticus]
MTRVKKKSSHAVLHEQESSTKRVCHAAISTRRQRSAPA